MATENKRIKIKADVYWAQLDKVNEMSGKYQVNLCNLSAAAVTAIEGMGISVMVGSEAKEAMGSYITCKSSNPIRAFDADGLPITENIGNDSKAVAMIGSYPWTYKNKKGVSPSLGKLVITDLIAYGEGEAMTAEDEDVL